MLTDKQAQRLIDSIRHGVPASPGHHVPMNPKEARGRRAGLLRPPDTSNGPTEAVKGRFEHLRGSALGFRSLSNHIVGSLPEAGRFRRRLHPGS